MTRNKKNMPKKYDHNEEEICKLYLEGLSLQKIADKFGVSKMPIRTIVSNHDILRGGTSNGQKIILTKEQEGRIKHLYLNEYLSAKEIAIEVGLTVSFVDKYLGTVDYRRTKGEGASIGLVKRYRGVKYDVYLDSVDEYKEYKSNVLRVTNREPIEMLDNYNKRGVSGLEGAYHLDHKYSILEGFKQSIDPEIIGNINNLEFIPWEENVKKRVTCSISKVELLNLT